MTAKIARHRCPACGAGLSADPAGTPLRCWDCGWHLISLEAWRKLPPFGQGYALYMQGSWPTSQIAKEKNPYPHGTPESDAFKQGEQRATQDAQDGEE